MRVRAAGGTVARDMKRCSYVFCSSVQHAHYVYDGGGGVGVLDRQVHAGDALLFTVTPNQC